MSFDVQNLIGQKYCRTPLLFWFPKQSAQAIEAAFPEGAAVFDPFFCDGKTLGFDAASADATDFLCVYKAAFFQDLQVLDDGGESDIERLRQNGNGNWAVAEFFYDGAPRGIAEGVEHAIHSDLLA